MADPKPMTVEDLLPDLPSYDPEPADGVRVGESPVPGLTLKRILRGHTDTINRIAWSPNGQFLASPSYDTTIRIWNLAKAKCETILKENTKDFVSCVAWSTDGKKLVSASSDGFMSLWGFHQDSQLKSFKILNFKRYPISFFDLAWVPNEDYFASASGDGKVRLWSPIKKRDFKTFENDYIESLPGFLEDINLPPDGWIKSIAWSPLGNELASAHGDGEVHIWNLEGDKIKSLKVNSEGVSSLAWSPDGKHLASTGGSNIFLWEVDNGFKLKILEGHAEKVNSVSFSEKGLFLASKGEESIRLWHCDSWDCIAVLEEFKSERWPSSCAFHPFLPLLATFCEQETSIRVWELDYEKLLKKTNSSSIKYTTAKVALVGDSGVGKTGLAWRLAHDEFKEHASTHGQQFWMINDLCQTREDGTECEAVMWDLAGQHVYRQIHSIFLDNVDASLVLFDPTNRQDPLKGARFWLEQLKGNKQLPPSILVGARMDRGGSTVSQEYLEQFCQQYGISGGYIGTSAKRGEGLEELIGQIKAQIPWDEMTTTVTTVTFKRIKDYVLQLKEQPDRQDVLVQPDTLRRQLQATDTDWQFTDAEMMTAVGHLETHGYVTILTSSAGDTHILLAPDLLVDLASSIVLQADKHPRELGAISEAELLAGEFNFEELAGLADAERQILLDAAVLRFLEHNVCFRETFGTDTLLIFPGLIKQKRPLEDDFPASDDVSYVVRGRVENLYAMLVVLLGYTPSFIRINHWQNQAQYAMGKDQICGFRMVEDREGEIELVLYYSQSMPAQGRDQFQELFERFLYQREVQVTRFPPVVCSNGHPLERATVISRIRDGRDFAFCAECGVRVDLPHLDQPSIGIESSDWLRREEAMARLRSTYEQSITRVKGYRRDWATPRCYLSFVSSEVNQAEKISTDLQEAGIYLIEDASQVQPEDYVVLLDSSAYQQTWQQSATNFETDAQLVKARLNSNKLISLTLEGGTTQPQNFEDCPLGNFSNPTRYSVNLFNLVLNLYAIPLTHAGFEPLRQTLHQQWEQTLSQLPAPAMTIEKPRLKIFISYAHEDEAFKDKLVKMLAGMQRRGLIDPWEDRQIEPGDDWFPTIQAAMDACDVALLLVSSDFIESRFINETEVPTLMERRQKEGMRVIPIILRPCMWTSEPALSPLQALPKNGQPIITFSADNGDRDQAWTDVAKAIEKLAKAKQAESD